MDIKQKILNLTKAGKEITVSDLVKKTGFSRAYIHRFFQALIEEGRLVKLGHANRARYVAAQAGAIKKARSKVWAITKILENKNLQEDKVLESIRRETGILTNLSENVRRILEYAFTEMLNNAIEHSRSAKIRISIKRDQAGVKFDVVDQGIGIFEKLIHSRHLASVEEAIQDLLKGKQTTAPEAHSGEGIFFTRRAGDSFTIRSSNKKLFFSNRAGDFTLATIKPVQGTKINFAIASNSKRELRKVFERFTTESFAFSATEVAVRLYRPGGETGFISRSQARRLLFGLDKFKKIILDFQGVATIGQGFADEIFRVWQGRFPRIEIVSINANADVRFMLKRAQDRG